MFSSLVFLNVDVIHGPQLGVGRGICKEYLEYCEYWILNTFIILRYEGFINFHVTVIKVVVTILTWRFWEFVYNWFCIEGTVRVMLRDTLR